MRRRSRTGPASLVGGRGRRRRLVAGGGLTAYRGYTALSRSGWRGARLLRALARADAAGGAAYGDVPAGPRTLLTVDGPARAAAARADQPGHRHPVATVRDHRRGRGALRAAVPDRRAGRSPTRSGARARSDWRLDRVAVGTRLRIMPAADRAVLLGGAVPTDAVLLFPGALPIRLDTPSPPAGARSRCVDARG